LRKNLGPDFRDKRKDGLDMTKPSEDQKEPIPVELTGVASAFWHVHNKNPSTGGIVFVGGVPGTPPSGSKQQLHGDVTPDDLAEAPANADDAQTHPWTVRTTLRSKQ